MIRLIKPYISFSEVESSFREIFASGILTKGRNVQLFREQLAGYTGAKHVFLTTSATTALSMALKLYGIGQGDEVIVSDFSFPATANVVEDLGATPVFADVDLETFNMLPSELEKNISARTRAVILVDAFGNPSGISKIQKICADRGLVLIEDAACALGSSEGGLKCGNIADITCFSFHPRKLLTCGEGGAITTNDDAIAGQLEIKLNHGGQVSDDGTWQFVDFGYNYRMSELQAAMGLVQLAKLDAIIRERQAVCEQYRKGLADVGFQPQRVAGECLHNVQSVVFVVPVYVDRDRLIAHLAATGVESTVGTYCLSKTPYYQKKYGVMNVNASMLDERTITFPCYAGVDMDAVLERIHDAMP